MWVGNVKVAVEFPRLFRLEVAEDVTAIARRCLSFHFFTGEQIRQLRVLALQSQSCLLLQLKIWIMSWALLVFSSLELDASFFV